MYQLQSWFLPENEMLPPRHAEGEHSNRSVSDDQLSFASHVRKGAMYAINQHEAALFTAIALEAAPHA